VSRTATALARGRAWRGTALPVTLVGLAVALVLPPLAEGLSPTGQRALVVS